MIEIRSWYGKKGKIPQVAHTYKVIGLMNEFQLAIGETTFVYFNDYCITTSKNSQTGN